MSSEEPEVEVLPLDEAIAAAVEVKLNPSDLLVGFVLIAEFVSVEDGDRYLSHISNEDSTPWQRMGYLDGASAWEKRKWNRVREEPE